MNGIPENLRYSGNHEWVREEDDGTIVIGVTDHAQQALGELVFVELPESGQAIVAGDAFAVVESVKAASDVYAPLGGEVQAVNEALADTPELINTSPYEDGWLVRLQPTDPMQAEQLMDSDAYQQLLAESEA